MTNRNIKGQIIPPNGILSTAQRQEVAILATAETQIRAVQFLDPQAIEDMWVTLRGHLIMAQYLGLTVVSRAGWM